MSAQSAVAFTMLSIIRRSLSRLKLPASSDSDRLVASAQFVVAFPALSIIR